MRLVIPVVFYEITNVDVCTRLKELYLMVKYFLRKIQLHVPALDHGHLQVCTRNTY